MSAELAIGALVFVTAGAFRAWSAVRERLRDRRQVARVRGVARVAIAAAGESTLVCVVGELVGELPLIAPITGRRCAYWTVEIQLHVGRSFESWERCSYDASERTAFTITDGNGRALVEGDRAEIHIDRDGGRRVGSIGPDTPAAQEWLEGKGLSQRGVLLPRRYRFLEEALSAEDPIAVVGVGTWEPDPEQQAAERGYRDGPATRLHLRGERGRPLFITDAPDAIGADHA